MGIGISKQRRPLECRLIGNLFRYFVEWVRADRFPSPDGEDDRAALEIALAATESLKSGRPVELSGRQR